MAPKAVLIGLPGSGKSTIGRRLAKAMGLALLDTDAAVEAKTGRTVADIFANDGEQAFRRIEEDVIRDALATHDGILSLGGGAVTTPGVREALVGHTVIFLEISAAEGVRRTGGSTVRPLLAGPDHAEKYRKLMNDRMPVYRRVATIRVNTNRRNPGAVVRHIVGRLENPPRRRRPPWRRSSPPQDEKRPTPTPSGPKPAPVESVPVTPATPAALAARRAGVRK
ncbi:shikimate kinase [Candidatus Mycolicibacterium alkanivorans]|uniref:Shikimate kinase n=1 Tax=Candidatus Mycolicibacterium alkanivorans TaxID=2954114 RepID=A0ABS9Z0R7_9MYCO|nr:shikimate kinase [Candidatus Mycolicibacterium alkanivorans]MCI4676149.1 shikimate kinase [Candidatus Mycolicibacterium alkanivorans]